MTVASEFVFAPTAEELSDVIFPPTFWPRVFGVAAALLGPPLIGFAVLAWKDPAEAWSFSALVVLYLVGIGGSIGLFMWYAAVGQRRLARVQSAAMRDDSCRVRITPGGIEMRSSSIESSMRWRAFTCAHTAKRNLVLHVRSGGTLALPLRLLDPATRRLILDAVASSTADTSNAAS